MVIPSGGCHRHIRRELLLCAISVTAESSRTDWVPNSAYATPNRCGEHDRYRREEASGRTCSHNPLQCNGFREHSARCHDVLVQSTYGQRVITDVFPWPLVDSGLLSLRERSASMTTLQEAVSLAGADSGLAVVSTLRADQTIQASLVNAGVLPHPATAEAVLGFVTYGRVKLDNLRARPHLAMTFRRGWQWATIEGRAELAGPDDPQDWLSEPDQLRVLLRTVFTACGGSHDNWAEYDRVMAEQGRTAVLIMPTRIYSNPTP